MTDVHTHAFSGGRVLGGLYEAFVGVDEPLAAIRYWERFGYHVGPIGRMEADRALDLYGVESGLTAIRLLHQDADHGLIRLMVWDRPAGGGLGMASWRTQGNRWAACLTDDVLNVANHAEVAQAGGLPISFVDPIYAVIHQKDQAARPFDQPLLGVREMAMTQPTARQVCFQRFGYTIAGYGRVNPNCLFRTSQTTHFGMVVQHDRHDVLDFYEKGLGLLRTADHAVPYEMAKGSRRIFDLREGEWHALVDFDGPESSTDYAKARSGRLKILRFRAESGLEDLRSASRPGQLGMSGYCYRVADLRSMRDRIIAAGAMEVTPILPDEFSRPSVCFLAPDGYHWTLFEA